MRPVAQWSVRGGTAPAATDVELMPAADHTCNHQCPWLEANHGREAVLEYDHEVPGIPMSDEPYAFAPWKRVRLWERDLRDASDGYGSVCHVRLKGTREREDGSWRVVARQCVGAFVMQHRELVRHLEHGTSALSDTGAARVAAQLLGRPVTVADLPLLDAHEVTARAHAALLDLDIGCSDVAPPLDPAEVDAWSRTRDGDDDGR